MTVTCSLISNNYYNYVFEEIFLNIGLTKATYSFSGSRDIFTHKKMSTGRSKKKSQKS